MLYDTWEVRILGPVTLKGLNKGELDMSKWKWSYKVCLKFIEKFSIKISHLQLEKDPKISGHDTSLAGKLHISPSAIQS